MLIYFDTHMPRTNGMHLFLVLTLVIAIFRPSFGIYIRHEPTAGLINASSRIQSSFASKVDDEWFKILSFDDSIAGMTMVNIGGKDRFLQLKLPGLEMVQMVAMLPEEEAQNRCITERQGSLCSNWIQTLIHFSNSSYLICGTNARQPKCQVRRSDFIYTGTEFSGVGLSTFEPTTNFTTFYTPQENRIYSLILEDEVESPIFSPAIVAYDVNALNPLNPYAAKTYVASRRHMLWPRFTSKAFDLGDKMLMFWTEKDDRGECPRRLTPYVGQFCKGDDHTASGNLGFMSFFKARLYCAHSDEMFGQRQSTQTLNHLMFDEIAGVSDRFGDDNDLFYVAFNRDYRDSQGVALCLFSVRNITEVFRTSRFRSFRPQSAQQDAYVAGLSVMSPKYPTIRPTECGRTYTDEEMYTLRANKSSFYSMMDRVQMGGGGAVFLDTVFPHRFTALAVDWNVQTADNSHFDVIYLGTENGRFLKVVSPHLLMSTDHLASQGWLVEDIEMFPGENVTDIRVVHSPERRVLIVSSSSIRILPFANCSNLATCKQCVEARDPYCSWDVASYKCVNGLSGLQDVSNGDSSECPAETTTTSTTTTTTTTSTTPKPRSTTRDFMTTVIEFGTEGADQKVRDCLSQAQVSAQLSQCTNNNEDKSAIVGSVVGVLAFILGIVLGISLSPFLLFIYLYIYQI